MEKVHLFNSFRHSIPLIYLSMDGTGGKLKIKENFWLTLKVKISTHALAFKDTSALMQRLGCLGWAELRL